MSAVTQYISLHPATRTAAKPSVELAVGISLQRGRIHELTGPSADMFAVLTAARHDRDIVWVGLKRDLLSLCPVGLQTYLDPARLLLVEAVSWGELLWATDQSLRAEGSFCVIADMPDALSLKESRRMQLAAEQGGGLGLLLLRGPAYTSAAQTRWHCMAEAAEHPSWSWACTKGKSGEAGTWHMTGQGGQNAKDTLHLALAAAP